MRKSRSTEEQMVKILREAGRLPVADVSKKHGVSEQTIYTWRKRFGAMSSDEVKRLRQLQRRVVLLGNGNRLVTDVFFDASLSTFLAEARNPDSAKRGVRRNRHGTVLVHRTRI